MLNEYIKSYVERYRSILEQDKLEDTNLDVEKEMYSNYNIIDACKQFLNDTDYIITKMSEETLLNHSVDNLKTKYNDVLVARNNARAKINELEDV